MTFDIVFKNKVKKLLEYPEKWDTMAYPSLSDAIWEYLSYIKCDKDLSIRKQKVKEFLRWIEDNMDFYLDFNPDYLKKKIELFNDESILNEYEKKALDNEK
jgi:hypothetical protein